MGGRGETSWQRMANAVCGGPLGPPDCLLGLTYGRSHDETVGGVVLGWNQLLDLPALESRKWLTQGRAGEVGGWGEGDSHSLFSLEYSESFLPSFSDSLEVGQEACLVWTWSKNETQLPPSFPIPARQKD